MFQAIIFNNEKYYHMFCRINLDLLDKGSGIQSISYTVYDVSGTREEIYSGSKEVEILSQVSN